MAIATHRTSTGSAGSRRDKARRGPPDALGAGLPARIAQRGDGQPRVLIVDDDPAFRMLCSVNLNAEGVVVLEAGDGRGALEQARSERPDLVVTDLRMPGLDGFQLAEALRLDERTCDIPLIFLTSETEPANASRARELGALAYLTKPFDPPALASLVRKSWSC